MEVQIRTYAMHIAAEYGIAAHWLYKSGKVAGNFKPREIALINRLKNWNRFNVDNSQFLDDLKEDILRDIIFVFTPAGEVIELPTGSTALDFAYHIHSEVGNIPSVLIIVHYTVLDLKSVVAVLAGGHGIVDPDPVLRLVGVNDQGMLAVL